MKTFKNTMKGTHDLMTLYLMTPHDMTIFFFQFPKDINERKSHEILTMSFYNDI